MVGLAVFFAYPSIIGQQDFASLLTEPVARYWLAHRPEAPGRTALPANMAAHAAAAPGIDRIVTGTARAVTDEELAIATEAKRERAPQRINRALKGDRVLSTTRTNPPSRFTAGSVLERHSMLEPLQVGENVELAFVQRRPLGEAIEVASLMHAPVNGPVIDDDLPVMVASLVRESVGNVLAYSNEDEPQSLRSPFAAVLDDERPITLIPKLGTDDHAWAAEPLPLSVFGEQEQNCLTAGIYFEARGEPVRGQAAVAQVILNRVKNPSYPDSICGVVYQNEKWRNRCQFSFACDGIRERVNDPKRWKIANYVARETTEGRIWLTQVGSSTHYHATYVSPRWARSMKKVGRIGLHIFYRTFGGGWS